ncbi:MarR family winged helix-turn-helix transcriptional regulator [Nocardioides sp. Arc9.136]|uniref:MarR family winged helix-turn-helix transcriptional regulator n=1 Tax=Nocardioides sp. Arc9.136 TaxID=2996826 RepID=UPI0026656FF0|nr:MarR family transcriptional regulator [Nocardioides sp. Arc9.136]WKN48549.1 MarR family transcriptional regulator [Nocardioides sp. Arc9.136]
MVDHPQLALDVQLCFPLYAATRAVTQRYGELLADVGLTYPQYLALLALWEAGGPVTVGGLGQRLRLDSGTLTPLLKRLEAVGHVSRRRDPADERRVLVEPTEQGWALRDRVAGVPERLLEGMGLSVEELVRLRRDLGTLLDGLDATAG